jgi:hypothetical protein
MSQHTPEIEDDDIPPVHFMLRNTDGDASELRLFQHMLGLRRYLLVQPGDNAIEVEGSHLDMDSLTSILALLLATAFQAEQTSDETREQVRALLEAAEVVQVVGP